MKWTFKWRTPRAHSKTPALYSLSTKTIDLSFNYAFSPTFTPVSFNFIRRLRIILRFRCWIQFFFWFGKRIFSVYLVVEIFILREKKTIISILNNKVYNMYIRLDFIYVIFSPGRTLNIKSNFRRSILYIQWKYV